MTQQEAEQIADLLNTRNDLTVKYTAGRVIDHADNYLFETRNGNVLACVEVRKVQWYQWEIRHLSVDESHEGNGLGTKLIGYAEEKAKRAGARITQCTIRVGNRASERVFRRNGYREACSFFNADSGQSVNVWQKVLSHRP